MAVRRVKERGRWIRVVLESIGLKSSIRSRGEKMKNTGYERTRKDKRRQSRGTGLFTKRENTSDNKLENSDRTERDSGKIPSSIRTKNSR